MGRTYLIDVVVRGQPPGAATGEEPVIAATRVAIEVPDTLSSENAAKAVGAEVRKVGAHFIVQHEQLAISLSRYEAAMEEELDFSDVPPEYRPN